MTETIDTTPPGAAAEDAEMQAAAGTGQSDERGPGLKKVFVPHQRTLDRWIKHAKEDFASSPYGSILCYMVEKRIPFVGGTNYGCALDPVGTDKVAAYIVRNRMTNPAEVAMAVFQTIHHDKINPDQIHSICRLIEQERFASVRGVLQQMATGRFDLGAGTISNRMAKRLDRVIPGVRRLEKARAGAKKKVKKKR
jgi:hypothetical protein